jgi:hypothetical protein
MFEAQFWLHVTSRLTPKHIIQATSRQRNHDHGVVVKIEFFQIYVPGLCDAPLLCYLSQAPLFCAIWNQVPALCSHYRRCVAQLHRGQTPLRTSRDLTEIPRSLAVLKDLFTFLFHTPAPQSRG